MLAFVCPIFGLPNCPAAMTKRHTFWLQSSFHLNLPSSQFCRPNKHNQIDPMREHFMFWVGIALVFCLLCVLWRCSKINIQNKLCCLVWYGVHMLLLSDRYLLSPGNHHYGTSHIQHLTQDTEDAANTTSQTLLSFMSEDIHGHQSELRPVDSNVMYGNSHLHYILSWPSVCLYM